MSAASIRRSRRHRRLQRRETMTLAHAALQAAAAELRRTAFITDARIAVDRALRMIRRMGYYSA